jgi:hypothetical protein
MPRGALKPPAAVHLLLSLPQLQLQHLRLRLARLQQRQRRRPSRRQGL